MISNEMCIWEMRGGIWHPRCRPELGFKGHPPHYGEYGWCPMCGRRPLMKEGR